MAFCDTELYAVPTGQVCRVFDIFISTDIPEHVVLLHYTFSNSFLKLVFTFDRVFNVSVWFFEISKLYLYVTLKRVRTVTLGGRIFSSEKDEKRFILRGKGKKNGLWIVGIRFSVVCVKVSRKLLLW